MTEEKQTVGEQIRKTLKKRLLAGVLLILPIYITYFVIKTLFGFVGGVFSPVVEKVIESNGYELPEVAVTIIGLILTFVALYLIGLFAANFIGGRLIHYFEVMVNRMPLIKTVYSSTKQIIQTATLPGKSSFKRVVLIDFPRPGVKALGFVTGDTQLKNDERFFSVFVPTTPNPTSGFLIFVPENDITDTTLGVEEGMKLLLSGGILTPPRLE